MNPAILIFALLFAVAGYLEAQRFEREYGSSPWRWEPWVWAIVLFFSVAIGLILLAIAERQGRNRGAAVSAPTPAQGQYLYGGPPTTESPLGVHQSAPGPITPAPAPAAPSSGFWAPDPSGRFEFRWWDGQQWTSAVSRAGVISQDAPTG